MRTQSRAEEAKMIVLLNLMKKLKYRSHKPEPIDKNLRHQKLGVTREE